MPEQHHIFLFTPPFTQLNTPYPATAYIKGFLNTLNVKSTQADLGLDVILSLFSTQGLQEMFASCTMDASWDQNIQRIYLLQNKYIQLIAPIIEFLQGKNDAFAYNICQYGFIPQGSRFENITDLEFAFGQIGIVDKAKYIATLFIEDLGDFIQANIDEHFGFSRYAERIARSAHTFDELHAHLQAAPTFIDTIAIQIIDQYIQQNQPTVIAFSVPFPGNLYAGLRIAKHIKKNYPHLPIIMGGGYPNTELRSVTDIRLFEYIDYLTLDDGERPIACILDYLEGKLPIDLLKRTFALQKNQVTYFNGSLLPDYAQKEIGTPDYSGLRLNDYISVIEVANPMHKLWSDGRWNKLTLAHGCYWGKCTFCDVSLDYIKNYEATTAQVLVDRIETIITQTGTNGFHFVDEAAPPALMKQLALELIKRKVNITWWTNIRFEKSFTQDLCQLLAASGCIAVSGGLEVASDRLLDLIQKGVTVAQVAQVTHNLTEAGIFVHAYLMYGFPTQTAQETIDALEYVRQMFEANILQSGYWHQFAMTAHSPIGKDPKAFKVSTAYTENMPFANNDLPHEDPTGSNHEIFSNGLKKSLFNFMNGIGIDFPLHEWFEFKVPKTTIPPFAIQQYLNTIHQEAWKPHHKLVWLGGTPQLEAVIKTKKGKQLTTYVLHIYTNQTIEKLLFDEADALFMVGYLPKLFISEEEPLITFKQFQDDYEHQTGRSINLLLNQPEFNALRNLGLLVI